MKNTLLTLKVTLIQFLIFFSFSAFSQCDIDFLFVDITACEGDLFDVSISFEYDNTSDQFTVTGNGNNYGTFNYVDLPITLTSLEADCITDYEFVVTDVNNNNCTDFVEWGAVCCEENCELWDLVLTTTECEGDVFQLTIDFNYAWNTSPVFEWGIVGVGGGNAFYADLPITVDIFNAQEPILEFVVSGEPSCAAESTFENPCVTSCVIGDLSVDISDCIDGEFSVELTFEHENTNSQFTVAGNGVNYGTFSYDDLPITIDGLDGDCSTEYEFIVTDIEDNDCFNFYELGTICCGGADCFIGDLIIEPSCDGDELFYVDIDFEYDNTSDEFFVSINGIDYGSYMYTDLPIVIEGLEADCQTEYNFFVYDSEFNGTCTSESTIDPVCCDEDCVLSDLILDSSGCNGGATNITIDFDYVNAPGGYFTWDIPEAGLNGTDFLVNLPIVVGVSGTANAFYTVYIEILDDETCFIEGEMENPCYDSGDCFIGDLDVDVSDCDGNFFSVVINFEYDNTSDQFTVNGNGNSYGTFSYADLPITIDIESDCNIQYEFAVHDVNNNDCASDIQIGAVCCDEGDCNITSIDFELSPICVDGFIVADWWIFSENTSEVGFDIFINDEFYIFLDYDGVGPYDFDIEDPGTEYFAIKACDNDNPDCCYTWELMNPCFEAECELLDLVIETSECDGGFFEVTFDFDYNGNTNNFFDWEIPGISSGFAEFSDLPLTVLIENTSMNGFDLFINENDNPNCAIEGSFENPCFGEDCFIGELIVDVSECDGNFFLVQINFEYENTSDQFTVNGNGNSYGTFLYTDLPITIDGLESDCNLMYEFVVHDVNNNDCFSATEIGEVCCDGDCEMTTLDFGPNPVCENGLIVTEWLIDGVNISEVGFDIFINNEFEVFVEYNDSDWYDFDIEDPGTEYFTIKVCDNDNADCCIDWEVMNPCFEGEDCVIGELDIDVSDCENNEFFVIINFEYENTSDEFTVVGNGVNYGTFAYADLPITIDGLEGNCDLEYEFIVGDVGNNNCVSDGGIGVICCDGDPCELLDLIIETSDCDGGFFEVTFDFDYNGNTNNFFDWEIPGITSGFAEFSDLPLTILIQNTNMNGFDLFINENDNPECAIEGSFENPCFDPEECFIGELDIDVSDCMNDMFFVVINFDYANTSENFFVNSNGENYGPYPYTALPVTIQGLEANCDVTYEFQVYDSENNGTCTSEINIGEVCCDGDECFIGELDVEVSECDGNQYFVVINFEYENTSENFTVNGNGNSYGTFAYTDLPISIDGLEADCDMEVEFVVNDAEYNDCASDFGMGPVCCDEEECDLFDLVIETSECDGGVYNVTFDFEYTGTTNSFFDWEIPGVGSGTAEFSDLPITIMVENTNTNVLVLHINENDNPECSITGEFENPCFESDECFIGELNIEVSECDGNQYFVVINFDYDNTSDQFTVNGNGNSYGTFSYADLPITIDGLESNCDLDVEFVVHDVNMNDCASDAGIGVICCDEEACEIVSIDFGANPICEENFIVTEWLILGENTSEVGYDIFINNEFYIFVEYNETDWYDFDIENPGTEYFTIMACDNDNADCCYTWEVMNPCFEETECDLFDLDFDVSECDGDFFLVQVDFEYTGNTNEWFDWEIPGIASGTDLFADLPITIEIVNTTDSQFTFFANENDNPNCSIVGTFGNPCYDSEECFIDGVTAEVVLCEDDFFDVEINFEYDNVGSTFSVVGNGVEYGSFEYSDLPITITGLAADCTLEYEFVVIDDESEDCSDFVEIGTICCEDFNQINGLQSETIIDGEIFNITFDITNTTLKGCNIDVFIDGELYETLPNTDSSFSIGPFNCGQEGVIEIKLINSCSGAEVTLMFDLSDIECITDVEEILDSVDLKWNMIQKTLTLDGELPVSVNVQLVNAQGALILAENNVNVGWNKDISNYPSGLYFVRIVDANATGKKGFIRKIVIY